MRRTVSSPVAISIAFLLRGFVQGSWYPRIPGAVDDVNVDPAQLGVIFFIYALGNIVAFTVAAKLIARMGSARTQMLFSLPFALIVVLLSLAPGTVSFAIGMFVFGLFAGGFDLSTSVQGSVVERRTRRPLISALYGFFSVGALSGAFISGFLAQAGVDIAIQFGVIGLIAIPITLIITTPNLQPDDMVPIGHMAPRRRLLLPSLPSKMLLPLGLTIVCIALGEETINNWAALYLRDHLNASSAIASAAYTAFAIATAIGRLGGDRVISRLGIDRTLISGSLMAAFGVGFGMVINQPWAIVTGYMLMGLGLAVVVPVTYRRANQIPGVAPAQAVATVASIGFLGFLIGPLLIGALADLTSLRTAMMAVSAVLFGVSILTKLNPTPAMSSDGISTGSITTRKGEPA